MNIKRILLVAIVSLSFSPIMRAKILNQSSQELSAYLFVYFSADRADEESIFYALSYDGYTYKALNSGKPVIDGADISDKGGVRDPHILRGHDGSFYMVVTDMKASQGWESNHGIVLMKSDNLVNWTHSKVDLKAEFPADFGNITRAWAPQTIYDEEKGKYMVYFSMKEKGEHPDIIYYTYTDSDFTTLAEAPQQLFFHPENKACIDGDIIFKDGEYHLFFKTEGDGDGIKKAVSDNLTGNYIIHDKYLQQTSLSVEGSCVFKLIDQEKYILMYDVYRNKRYEFAESEDLENFRLVTEKVSMDFFPRHGTVITITKEEAERLVKEWGK